nr:immunoglobulin light chain junction region [Macaca mulatta]
DYYCCTWHANSWIF